MPSFIREIMDIKKFEHLSKSEWGLGNLVDIQNLAFELMEILQSEVLMKSQLWEQLNLQKGTTRNSVGNRKPQVKRDHMLKDLRNLGMLEETQNYQGLRDTEIIQKQIQYHFNNTRF